MLLRKTFLTLLVLQLSNQNLYASPQDILSEAPSVASNIARISFVTSREIIFSVILCGIISKLFADYTGVWLANQSAEHSTLAENIKEHNQEIRNPRFQMFIYSLGTMIAFHSMLQLCFRYTLPYWHLAQRMSSCLGAVDFAYYFSKAMPVLGLTMSMILFVQNAMEASHSSAKTLYKASIIGITSLLFLLCNLEFFNYLKKTYAGYEAICNNADFYLFRSNFIPRKLAKMEKYPFICVFGYLIVIGVFSFGPVLLWYKSDEAVAEAGKFVFPSIFPQDGPPQELQLPQLEDNRTWIVSKYRLYLCLQCIGLCLIWHYNIHYIIRNYYLLSIRILSLPAMFWFYTYSESAKKMSDFINKHFEEQPKKADK